MGLSNRARMPPPRALGETDRQPVDDVRIVGAIWALVPGDHRTRAQRLDGVQGGDRVAAASQMQAVVLSHGHFDHAGGLAGLAGT